jgi:hypothetical protein
MTTADDKATAQRLRRWAKRLRLVLRRSRSRFFHADDHGLYQIVELDTGKVIAGEKWTLRLEDVEDVLDNVERKMRAGGAA